MYTNSGGVVFLEIRICMIGVKEVVVDKSKVTKGEKMEILPV